MFVVEAYVIGIYEVIDTAASSSSWESIVAVLPVGISIVALVLTYLSMLSARDSAEASKISARAADDANRIVLYPRRLAIAQAVQTFLTAASGFDGEPKNDFPAIQSFNLDTEEVEYLFGSNPVRDIKAWARNYHNVRKKLKQSDYQDQELHEEYECLRDKLIQLQAEADNAFAPYLRVGPSSAPSKSTAE